MEPEATYAMGDELGRFSMGSTVILVFPDNQISWTDGLESGTSVQLGERIGVMHSLLESK